MDLPLKVAYVAGPLRADTLNGMAENIARARAVSVHLWRLGYAVICPHLNSAFMSGAVSESQFLEAGLEFLRRSNLVVLVDGWERSEGTVREIEEAHARGIPVFTTHRNGRGHLALTPVEVCING